MAEERREKRDEALDKSSKLMQRFDERLTLDNLALSKRYLKNELRIHVHIRATGSGGYPEHFCAIFQRELPVFGTPGESYQGAGLVVRRVPNSKSTKMRYYCPRILETLSIERSKI